MSIDLEKLRRQYQGWNPRVGRRGDCTLCGADDQHYEDCWWGIVGELIAEVERLQAIVATAHARATELQ